MKEPKVRLGGTLLCLSILAALVGAAGKAQADNIPIDNPSFDDVALAENNYTAQACAGDLICVQTPTPVLGWTVEGVAGTWNPTATAYPGGVPEGSNIAYVNDSASLSQIMSAVLVANRLYRLGVDVGNRADKDFPDYRVQLWAGATLLAEDDNLGMGKGTFKRSILDIMVKEGDPGVGENLEIVLTSNGGQRNFDDVRLDEIAMSNQLVVIDSSSPPKQLGSFMQFAPLGFVQVGFSMDGKLIEIGLREYGYETSALYFESTNCGREGGDAIVRSGPGHTLLNLGNVISTPGNMLYLPRQGSLAKRHIQSKRTAGNQCDTPFDLGLRDTVIMDPVLDLDTVFTLPFIVIGPSLPLP